MQALAYMLRDYSPALVNFLVDQIPPQGTFFDVGSNIGLVCFGVSHRRPDVTIHAFEPSPVNVEGWKRNKELAQQPNATLAEVALSDHCGTANFWVPSDTGSGMIRAAIESGVADAQPSPTDLLVPTVTLDDYCEKHNITNIDVLKLDVQGHEPAVLRGAGRLLERGAIANVICELTEESVGAVGISAEDITQPLVAAGMRPIPIPSVGVRRAFGRQTSPDDVAYVLA